MAVPLADRLPCQQAAARLQQPEAQPAGYQPAVAALIGVTLLGEPFRLQRAAAAVVIVLGVVAFRLA